MKEELLRHKLAYGVLVIVLVIFVAFFLLAWPNRSYQKGLILMMSVFYFGWGVVTHTKSDRLTARVATEYMLVSVLAGLLLWLVVW